MRNSIVSRLLKTLVLLIPVVASIAFLWNRKTSHAAAQGPCVAPPSGLVSWWPGDGRANDISDSNPGTLVGGVTFAPGKVGRAFSFDGITSAINISNSPNLDFGAGDFSISTWINFSQGGDLGASGVFIIFDHYAGNPVYRLYISPSGMQAGVFFRDNNGNSVQAEGTSSLNDGQWHYLVGERSGTNARIYVDGVLENSATNPAVGTISTASCFARIGATNTSTCTTQSLSGGHFKGLIDELQVFNRSLTQSEVQTIFKAGQCKPSCNAAPPGLVSLWPGDGNANDIVGPNDGVREGTVSFAPGKVGQAFKFNGDQSDGINLGDVAAFSFAPTDSFSIETWINISALAVAPNDGAEIIALNYPCSNTSQRLVIHPDGRALFEVRDNNAASGFVISPSALSLNTWHHLAGVREVTGSGKTVGLFVDGVLVASAPDLSTSLLTNNGSDYIGRRITCGNANNPFNGLIDEVSIYNRALSAAEIQAIFSADSAGKCKNSAPVASCRNMTVSADANCTANASIDNGSSDPDGDTITLTQSPAGPYPLGNTTVTLTVTDSKGVSSQCTATITVVDTTLPQLTSRPPDASYQCFSQIPAGNPSQATATDNCSTPTITVADVGNGGAGSPSSPLVIARYFTAIDAAGNSSSAAQIITVIDNTPPVIACPANINVVGNIPRSCAATVNPGTATATDNCAGVIVAGVRSDGQPLTAAYPLGTTTITWTATDAAGNRASCQQQITVTNPTPTVMITGPATGSVHAVNTPVNFTGSFTDNLGGTHTAIWTFDSLTHTGAVNETTGAVSVNHTFATAGVYSVTLTVADGCGGTGMADTVDGLTALVVVYDPNGGFVTGGGWINSPAGAYVPNPSLTGKANFGFVSKYEPGANVPTGQTEFQFKAGNLNFHSTSYEWLVVAGKKAQYKGVGTINGSGNYRFMLTAIDGDLSGGDGKDKFRIKIWSDGGGLVYDNQLNAPDSDDPTTVLGGGSVVIHK